MPLSRMKFAISVRSVAWPPQLSSPSFAAPIHGSGQTQTIAGNSLSRALISSCLNQAFCAVPQSVRTSASNFLNGALVPNDVDTSYDYWLPSLNLRLEVGGGLQFRAAYTKGISPPSPGLVRNYYVVSLAAQPNTDANGQALPIVINPDGTVPPGQARVEGQFNAGNPYLKPVEADSYDLTG